MERFEPLAGDLPKGLHGHSEAFSPGVCWSAVIGGAFVTAALSVALLALGAGLGLSAISPWTDVGATATAVGTVAIIWLIAVQAFSSTMGGYLAGRLRTKWTAIHTHEVYFRDTAHGFLVWAVALVIAATFLSGAAATMAGGTTQHVTSQVGNRSDDPLADYVARLFRSERPLPDVNTSVLRAEVGGILANALQQKEIPAEDKAYLVQLIMAATSLQHADAETRLADVFTSARNAIENVRKVATHVLLWLFIALLTGAFSASLAATIGGRQRDAVEPVLSDFGH